MILTFLCPITWKRSAVRIKIQEFHIVREKSKSYVLSIGPSWQLTLAQTESQQLVSQSIVGFVHVLVWILVSRPIR